MQSTTLLTIFISSVSAASLGFYSVSFCPYDATALATYTNNSLTGTTTSSVWAGKPLSAQQSCPSRLTPAPQSIAVNSFSKAQHNIDRWVPRSNTYAMSIFRPEFVASAYVDFDIVDASHNTVVPRMQVTLQAHQSSSSQLTTLSTRRSKRTTKGKRHMLATQPGSADDDVLVIEEQAINAKRFRTKPHLGRRKGKGGVMGGIGGGGRYGGGNGGFRTSAPGGHTKTYGYSTSAMSSRFRPGYTRTTYGYTGRSVIFVGSPMYLYSHGGHGGYYRQSCQRYTGDAQLRCQKSYNSCNGTIYSNGCQYKARSALIRDDLMAATVNAKNVTFPLTITIHKAVVMFKGTQPDPWEQALLFSFSEVDYDDEEDVIMEFWVFCVLLSIGFVVLCCMFCFVFFQCGCAERLRRSRCCCRKPSENKGKEGTSGTMIDLEAPKQAWCETEKGGSVPRF